MGRRANTAVNTLKTALRGCGVSLMVVIYLAGAIQFNTIHASLHPSTQEELHSPENEKEACHQAIYHRAPEGSCHHKTHLVANDKCALCHSIVPLAHVLVLDTPQYFADHNSLVQRRAYTCSYQNVVAHLPSRAPPVCQASAS